MRRSPRRRKDISPGLLLVLCYAGAILITETAPPAQFIGKSLIELGLRRKYGVTLIAIKDVLTGQFYSLPPATHVIKDSDLLILIGKSVDVDKACRTT